MHRPLTRLAQDAVAANNRIRLLISGALLDGGSKCC